MRYTTLFLSCLAMMLASCSAGDEDDTGAADTDSQTGQSTSDSPGSTTSEQGTTEQGDTSTGADPFAECDRGTLELDLMGGDPMGNPAPMVWMGPGVDPETGMLIDDGGSYVVSSTYLAMKPEPAAQQAFGEVTPPLIPELFMNPGMVAFQLGVSNSCASARTLTVWRDDAAMMTFVVGDAHMAAIGRIAEISRGTSIVTHWSAAGVADITWDSALEHMLADEGPVY